MYVHPLRFFFFNSSQVDHFHFVFAVSMEVGEFLDSGKVPGRFFTLLDQKPEETWKSLGTKLGIDNATLEGIKIDCATQHQNPAKHVIEMIYTSNPTLTIDQFKKHLENITRNDVKKKLDNLPGTCMLTELIKGPCEPTCECKRLYK